MRETELKQAVAVVLGGGVLIYPTETLYALGCDARNLAAVSRVLRLKGRPANKPLPVVVGDMDGLARIAADGLSDELQALGKAFWPGPLSVLVRTGSLLAPAVRDAQGFTSVRITPHPLARALCLAANAPIVATSANMSGAPATADPAELDPVLTVQADCVLEGDPLPAGGQASTVVALLGGRRLGLVRAGAVPAADLEALGFQIEPLA